MADSLPQNFISPQESVASYDYFEFASSIGYKTFYGLMTDSEVSSLTATAFSSNALATTLNSTQPFPSIASSIDNDLDFTFQKPMIIDGTAKLKVSIIEGNLGGSGTVGNSTTYTIYHVNSAGIETQIGQTTSSTTAATLGTNSFRSYPVSKLITLTRTEFGVGEKIRLSIAITLSGTGGSKRTTFTADPYDADTIIGGVFTASNTSLELNLPFWTGE